MLTSARRDAVPVAAENRTGRVDIVRALLVGVTVLAAVLRFATLTMQSLWFDEAQLVHETTLSFGGLLHTIGSTETSPPLYFVVAWVWAKVFGASPGGLRSLSAVAGVAVVPLTYLIGRELVSRWAGLVAAALAAISPFMIWYSQEAREYMLLTALSAASLLYFARTLRAPTRRNVTLWALFSGLALLTHFFAGFLVAPEALWLLARHRSRAVLAAVAAVVAVEAALIPLAISDTGHPLGWLTVFPLSTRLEQVPVTFALNTLYRSSIVSDGWLGAGVLAAIVVFLLVAGAERDQLRGAGVAAALAACVLVIPLLFAAAGHDFIIARALIPAWVPLAVVLGAACTTPRARIPGLALGLVLAAGSIFAQVRITEHAAYQRPDWQGVAAALGRATGPRGIVVYEGALASDPLKLYLPHVAWNGPTGGVRVRELDVVASPFQTPARPLPAGAVLIGQRDVAGYRIARFALSAGPTLSADAMVAEANRLLAPASGSVVLLQSAP